MKGLATPIGIQTSTSVVADQAEIWHLCLRCALPAELMSCLSRLLTSPGWGAATRKGKKLLCLVKDTTMSCSYFRDFVYC